MSDNSGRRAVEPPRRLLDLDAHHPAVSAELQHRADDVPLCRACVSIASSVVILTLSSPSVMNAW